METEVLIKWDIGQHSFKEKNKIRKVNMQLIPSHIYVSISTYILNSDSVWKKMQKEEQEIQLLFPCNIFSCSFDNQNIVVRGSYLILHSSLLLKIKQESMPTKKFRKCSQLSLLGKVSVGHGSLLCTSPTGKVLEGNLPPRKNA